MRAVWAIIAAATFCTLAVIVVRGLDRENRLSGTNRIEAPGPTIHLRDGRVHCQNELLPADTDRVQLPITTRDGTVPPIEVTLKQGARVLAHNRTRGSASDGYVPLPLGRVIDRARPDVTLCVRPRAGDIALAGFAQTSRVEWLRPGRPSYLEMLGTISHRFGLGKLSWFGAWTFWAAVALVVAIWVLAVRVLLGEVRRP